MSQRTQMLQRWSCTASALTLVAAGMTGCSAFDSSYVQQPEPAVSLQAVASAEGDFVAQPFSLVAADSVGLATFGFEIAQWHQMTPEALAQQY